MAQFSQKFDLILNGFGYICVGWHAMSKRQRVEWLPRMEFEPWNNAMAYRLAYNYLGVVN
jgi:hypothetical protein